VTPGARRDQNAALGWLFLGGVAFAVGVMAAVCFVEYLWRHLKWTP